MTCVNISAMTTTSGTPSNQRMIGMRKPPLPSGFHRSTRIRQPVQLDLLAMVPTNPMSLPGAGRAWNEFRQTGVYCGNFLMTKDQLMPILIWIAAVACMWEIAGAGIHLRPGDESPAETEPRLARPARRPPAIS
jgi:hypothetical protein